MRALVKFIIVGIALAAATQVVVHRSFFQEAFAAKDNNRDHDPTP